MSKVKFPKLKELIDNELYASETVSDGDLVLEGRLSYYLDVEEKDLSIHLDTDDKIVTFTARKQHIPFLEQLLADLKEVTE